MSSFDMPTLDEEAQVSDLLAWTFTAVSAEMPDGIRVGVERAEPDVLFQLRSASVVVDSPFDLDVVSGSHRVQRSHAFAVRENHVFSRGSGSGLPGSRADHGAG